VVATNFRNHREPPDAVRRRRELALRVASTLVLVPLALGTAYFGGWPFAIVWWLAAVGVLWEWATLVAGERGRWSFAAGTLALTAALVFAPNALPSATVSVLVGVVAAGMLAPAELRLWMAGGVIYSALVFIPPILLRADTSYGFVAILVLFAVVWANDIAAFFVGRTLGGPRLVPQLSPKKTWSGSLGGALAGMLAGLSVGIAAGLSRLPMIAAIALALAVVAQAGDLLESGVKRRFGAKDSGNLIPGHGGLMDRLDSFIAAALAAALFGMMRGGPDASARGLLLW
jgi:phosphatidate cytidylyltransferase